MALVQWHKLETIAEVMLPGGKKVVQVVAGANHSIVLSSKGKVCTFRANDIGRCRLIEFLMTTMTTIVGLFGLPRRLYSLKKQALLHKFQPDTPIQLWLLKPFFHHCAKMMVVNSAYHKIQSQTRGSYHNVAGMMFKKRHRKLITLCC